MILFTGMSVQNSAKRPRIEMTTQKIKTRNGRSENVIKSILIAIMTFYISFGNIRYRLAHNQCTAEQQE